MLEVKIELECEICKEHLEVISNHTILDTTIVCVAPCKNCLNEAYDEGKLEVSKTAKDLIEKGETDGS